MTVFDNVLLDNCWNRIYYSLQIATRIEENFCGKVVSFNQSDIIGSGLKLPDRLKETYFKFQGLCELICNKVLIDDLLGQGTGNFFRREITVMALDTESIVNSHLMKVYTVFHRMIAFLFGIYPDNIFSVSDQWRLVRKGKVNEDILLNGLKNIAAGKILKLEVFKRDFLSFSGHSLLIKKTSDAQFTFFDPNTGEHRGVSQGDLVKKINDQLVQWQGTDIFIITGDSYLKRLENKKIIEISRKKQPVLECERSN